MSQSILHKDKNSPYLSVIIVTICGINSLKRCLNSLYSQSYTSPIEIIVSYDERLTDIPIIKKQYPEIITVTTKGMQTPEELASIGIRQTQGRIIALTEDHCIPDKDWCEEIIEAHKETFSAIGGPVVISTEDPVSWAFAFTDYYRYLSPVPEGPTPYLTVCNVSYKRESLEKVSYAWKHHFHEVAVHEALLKQGELLYLTNRIKVRQWRELSFKEALHERYSFGRLFGSRRAIDIHPQRRIIYTIFAPLIPLLLFGRMVKNIVQRKNSLAQLFVSFPYLWLFILSWSLGEFIGNLTGKSPSDIYIARDN